MPAFDKVDQFHDVCIMNNLKGNGFFAFDLVFVSEFHELAINLA